MPHASTLMRLSPTPAGTQQCTCTHAWASEQSPLLGLCMAPTVHAHMRLCAVQQELSVTLTAAFFLQAHAHVNSIKIHNQWRRIMRMAKTEELREEIEILAQSHEREVDRKDAVIQVSQGCSVGCICPASACSSSGSEGCC